MDKFVLEYGRHSIDDTYPIAEFVFAGRPNFTTDLSAFNFVAIIANSSHVSLHMQVCAYANPPSHSPAHYSDGVISHSAQSV
jgi:hypothetical protein